MHYPRLRKAAGLVAALCLGLVLAAGEASQAANHPPIDLAVDKVWVGADCRVKVRLVRKGSARLPEGFAKKIVLQIKVGGKKRNFTFKQVDPKGALLRGPAAFTFASSVKVDSKDAVTAKADPQGLFSETNEANNSAKAPAPPAKCTAPAANLDWIKVQRLYLADKQLHIVMAFYSKAAIAAGELERVGLRISGGAKARGAWPMAAVYARSKRLGRGQVVFNTTLAVKPGSQVRVLLTRGGLAKMKTFTLPRASGVATAKGPAGGRGVPKGDSHGITIHKPNSRQIARRGGSLGVLYSVGSSAPAGYIDFALYRGEERLNSIRVRYEPSTGSAPAERQLHYPIPRNAPHGRGYFIKASMGSLWGESDKFRIEPFGEGSGPASSGGFEIRVVSNNGGGNPWHQGKTYMISWRLTGTYPGEPRFVVKLLRGGAPVLTIDSSAAVWQANSRTYTLDWTIPQDLPSGNNYRIQVADRNGPIQDVSDENFSISGPIIVSSGTRGTYYWSHLMTIRCQLPGWASISHLKVTLLDQAGNEVLRLYQGLAAHVNEQNVAWPVGTNIQTGDGWKYSGAHGAPMRGVYRIRVEDPGNPAVHGLGPPFTIAEPTFTVTATGFGGGSGGGLGGEPNYDGYNISWSSPELGTGGRVNIRIVYSVSGGAGFARYHSFAAARDRPSTGTLIWHHGDHAPDSHYPRDSDLPQWGYVRVVPAGFDDFYTSINPNLRVYIEED